MDGGLFITGKGLRFQVSGFRNSFSFPFIVASRPADGTAHSRFPPLPRAR
jgi:hypothetical protein